MLVEDAKTTIEKARGRVAWLEKEIATLQAEYATLPSVGYHRPRYLELRKQLKHLREALEAEKQELVFHEEFASSADELNEMMTPEMREDFEKFMHEQEAADKDRRKRDRVAEERREAFKVIDGGRVEE